MIQSTWPMLTFTILIEGTCYRPPKVRKGVIRQNTFHDVRFGTSDIKEYLYIYTHLLYPLAEARGTISHLLCGGLVLYTSYCGYKRRAAKWQSR